MLNLIFQGGQLLDDGFALLTLLFIGDITNGAMKIVNRTSLDIKNSSTISTSRGV